MKYLKQFSIILLITFLGEVLAKVIPLPIPAGIYGIVILLVLLLTGVLKLSQVKETAHFLLDIMTVMFIPAVTGVIKCWDVIRGSWYLYLIILVVSTVAVMGVSALVTQFVIRKEDGSDE